MSTIRSTISLASVMLIFSSGCKSQVEPKAQAATGADVPSAQFICAAQDTQKNIEHCASFAQGKRPADFESACHCACEAGHGWSCTNLGAVYLQMGAPQKALPPLTKSCEATDGKGMQCLNLAVVHGELGNTQKAIDLSMGLCALGVHHACVNAAWYLALDDKGQEALSAADKALAIEPSDGAGHMNRGHALLLLGRSGDASAAYINAIRINSAKRGVLHEDLEFIAKAVPRIEKDVAQMRKSFGGSAPAPDSKHSLVAVDQGANSDSGKPTNLVPGSTPKGPGEAYDNPEHQQACRNVIDDVLTQNTQSAERNFGEVITVGPALWGLISKNVKNIGSNAVFKVPVKDGFITLTGRVFRTEDLASLIAVPEFQNLMKNAGQSAPRAASAQERQVFYMTIPFEIHGEPVTVVGEGDNRLLMMASEGRILWMDAPGLYSVK